MVKLEDLREEIFNLYINDGLKLKDVTMRINQTHGTAFTYRYCKKKVGEWEIERKKGHEFLRAVILRAEQDGLRIQEIEIYYKKHLIKREAVERFKASPARRRKSVNSPNQFVGQVQRSSPLTRTLSEPEHLEATHHFIYNLEYLIRDSFKSRKWYEIDKNSIIHSSSNQLVEQEQMVDFVQCVEEACEKGQIQPGVLPIDLWNSAFEKVGGILKCSHHDIIPNIVRKIADLQNQGFGQQAEMLVSYTQEMSEILEEQSGHPFTWVMTQLRIVDCNNVNNFDDLVNELFYKLFYEYLGTESFNSFAFYKEWARRRLQRDPSANIDDYVPVNNQWHELDTRSLEVLDVRTEVLKHRAEQNDSEMRAAELWYKVEEEARMLLQQAAKKSYDVWQCHYFRIRAYYCSGKAYLALQQHEGAVFCFYEGLTLLDAFIRRYPGYKTIFRNRGAEMKEQLAKLGYPWRVTSLTEVEESEVLD